MVIQYCQCFFRRRMKTTCPFGISGSRFSCDNRPCEVDVSWMEGCLVPVHPLFAECGMLVGSWKQVPVPVIAATQISEDGVGIPQDEISVLDYRRNASARIDCRTSGHLRSTRCCPYVMLDVFDIEFSNGPHHRQEVACVAPGKHFNHVVASASVSHTGVSRTPADSVLSAVMKTGRRRVRQRSAFMIRRGCRQARQAHQARKRRPVVRRCAPGVQFMTMLAPTIPPRGFTRSGRTVACSISTRRQSRG